MTRSLKNGNVRSRVEPLRAELHQHVAGDRSDNQFEKKPPPPRKPVRRALRHLQKVVIEADGAVTDGNAKHHPDVAIRKLRPEQRRNGNAGEDHQPAHRRRAALQEMALRTVIADRLSLALLDPQQIDDGGSEHHHEQKRRKGCAAGSECDVAKNVQRADLIAEIDELIEHARRILPLMRESCLGDSPSFPNRAFKTATTGPRRVPFDALTIITSPRRKLEASVASSADEDTA